MTDRIVMTGAGVISALGAGLDAFEHRLYDGASGVAPSARFDQAPAAEITDFNPQPWLGSKGIRVLDRSARLLAVAAQMALSGARLCQNGEGDPELGLVCGTMFGSVHSITAFDWSGLTDGRSLVNPMEFPNTVINSPAGQAAIRHRLRGVNSTISAGLSSGLIALDYAAQFLRFGRARLLLAGGVEELCEESLLGFRKTGLYSATSGVRPFGEERDGTVPGEGSALCVLEREESARERGAAAWIEICGCGVSYDAHSAQAAVEDALVLSGIGPEQVACIVASANGTRGDELEARALKKVFASRLGQVPVCAPKAAFGEAMGASGALSAVVAALALRRQAVPPTLGAGGADQGLRLAAVPQPFQGDYALINAFGCDGNNASLVVRRNGWE